MARGGKRPGAGRPRTNAEPTKSTTLELTEEHRAWIRSEATRTGRSMSSVARAVFDAAIAKGRWLP